MKQDVLNALCGKFPENIPSKESLNHPEFINRISGMDVFIDTEEAFERAWEQLGIDIHIAVTGQAMRPKVPGGSWIDDGNRYADLGVYPTSMPLEHMAGYEKSSPDWVYQYDPADDDFDLEQKVRDLREINVGFRRRYGTRAVHYHLYYTTLFMWPVVKFDWESFMIAAALDPERFDRHFWQPWTEISRKNVEALCRMDEEIVFTHDDLTMSTGPVFPPEFYDTYIFPRYHYIFEPIRKSGKKMIFVIDGNCDVFLEKLLEFPIDAIMYENPATPYQRVLDTWGKAKRGFIGGIDTTILTRGTAEEVFRHTNEVIKAGRKYPGFIISSCGGLHGNIRMENMFAYFDARKQ